MTYYIWTGADQEDENNKKKISKKEAIEIFGADFVREATNSFKRQNAKDKAIVGITYNSIGSCWDEDYIYNLTVEK